MRVVTYAASMADNAPEAHRCLARIQNADGSWCPVLLTAPDKPAARARAETWWAAELERERRRRDAAARRVEAMRTAREAKRSAGAAP
jgi:hypothetical protein